MVETIEGGLDGSGLKIGLAVSRFNDIITEKLMEGAVDCLVRHGVAKDDIVAVKTPGAFELPLVAKRLAESGKYDAVVCVGSVIRGSTSHHQYISSEVTKGLAQVMMDSGVPVAFGVLTPENLEQAIERAGGKAGNKGWEAALAAIEMANLFRKL